MEFLQLKYFCDAAQTENFSRTASKFSVPASNISQTIHRLENELGTALFDRHPNSIRLNEAGRVFFENVSRALELIESASVMVSDVGVCGEIKLLVLANRRIVTDVIEKFRKQYPGVSFSISHTYSGGDFDFIITADLYDSAMYNSELLVDEELLVAVSRDNPISELEFLTPLSLRDQRFISMQNGQSNIASVLGFQPNVVIRTDDPFYVRKYVELGMGIALFPSVSWNGMFSENVICKNLGGLRRKTYVLSKKDRYLTRAARIFLELLLENKFIMK